MLKKEYIERNALIAEYDRVHIGTPGGARKLMVEAPTADVVEVKHGEWKGESLTCSVCDDGNDGLTNEEAKAYENECRAEAMLKAELRRLYNYGSFWDDDTYSHPIKYQK